MSKIRRERREEYERASGKKVENEEIPEFHATPIEILSQLVQMGVAVIIALIIILSVLDILGWI